MDTEKRKSSEQNESKVNEILELEYEYYLRTYLDDLYIQISGYGEGRNFD